MSDFDPFDYHAPNTEQLAKIDGYRDLAKIMRDSIVKTLPSSRERSLALTHLEEALMWSCKAVFAPPNLPR